MKARRPITSVALLPALALAALVGTVAAARPGALAKATEDDLVAPDGVPYDNEDSAELAKRKARSGNLLANGSFEKGRYWPYGWEAVDGLTTFWHAGGSNGQRCIRIDTDVLDAQWKAHSEQVRGAVEAAARRAGGDPQSAPLNPLPSTPERVPTQPPYYNTVAGLHGVHYRSAYVKAQPGAVYRFSVDARTEAEGEPRVFIKGFFDQEMMTRDGPRVVRRNAYRAPMILDPCDKQWRRYVREFHPSRSKSTLGDKPLKTEWLQVQIYAYWKPGNYYFDNARLEIIGIEEVEKPGPRPRKEEPPDTGKPAELDQDGFPIFDP